MADNQNISADVARLQNSYDRIVKQMGADSRPAMKLKAKLDSAKATAKKVEKKEEVKEEPKEEPKVEAKPKATPKPKSKPAKKSADKETRHVFEKKVDGGKEVKVVMAKSRAEAEEAMSGQGYTWDREITRGRSPKEGFVADAKAKGAKKPAPSKPAPKKRATKADREEMARDAGMTESKAKRVSEKVTSAKKRGRKPMEKQGYLYEMPLKTQAGKVKRKVIIATSRDMADKKAGRNYTFLREVKAGENPKVGIQSIEGYVKPAPKKRGRKPKVKGMPPEIEKMWKKDTDRAIRVAENLLAESKAEAIGEGVAIADKAMTGNLEGVYEALETLNGEIGKMQREVARIQGEVTKLMSGKKMARGGNTLGSLAEGVNAFAMFALNFPTDWVRDAFDGNAHLINKFNSLYDRVGSDAVVLKFYTQLDGGNKKTMENYIANWSKKSMARGGRTSATERAALKKASKEMYDHLDKVGMSLDDLGGVGRDNQGDFDWFDISAGVGSDDKFMFQSEATEDFTKYLKKAYPAVGSVKKKLEDGGTTDDKPKVSSLSEVFMLMDGNEVAYDDMDKAEKMFGGDPLTPQELVDQLAGDHDIFVMDYAPELFDLPDGEDEDDDEYYTGNVKDSVTINDIEDAIEDQLEADNSYNYSAPFVFDVRFTKTRDPYDPQIMIVREHRGGDVRGNYGDAMAFSIDADTNPFYGNITLNIETDKGSISLTAETLESWNWYVNTDETGTFEEDDVVNRDDIEEALDFGDVKSEILYIR